MGFIRNQEEKLAAKILRWQYEKQKLRCRQKPT